MLMQPYNAILQRLESKGRLRNLNVARGADFSSNDYLALSGSGYLRNIACEALERGVPVGSGGSRLLRGNHPEHEALEAEAAAFFKAPQVLYFASGFDANQAVFATLPQAGDLVLYDALIHASIHAGMQAGKAKIQSVPHNDIAAFEAVIRHFRATEKSGNIWLVFESLYSMYGDRAPLAELSALADRYGCFLYIDEAHATGVFGADGRGLAAELEGRENVLILHTCGKALGASGALLCAVKPLIDVLTNRARGFIFSTAPAPLQAAIVRGSLKALAAEPQRREKLHTLICHAEHYLQPSGSQIIPYLIGDNQRAVTMAEAMQNHGFDIRAIRPPTVPLGTARLRISITLNVDEAQISHMAEVLKKIANLYE